MMDFFRKHQKFILLLMAVLMVMFLVPQACDRGGRGWGGGRDVIGQYTLSGRSVDVTAQDVIASHAEVELLRSINGLENSIFPYIRSRGIHRDTDRLATGLPWLLWNRLAEHYEVQATEQERHEFFRDNRVTSEHVEEARRLHGTTATRIYEVVDKLVALNKLSRLAMTQAMAVADYEVRQRVRDVTETAQVNLVEPNIEQFSRIVEPPTQERLTELFERYRGVQRDPARGEPIGYYLPDRVSFEILLVDVAQTISEQQIVEYYTNHPEQFQQDVPATQPAETQPAATQPAAPARQLRPLDDQLREQIRRRLLDEPVGPVAQAGPLQGERLTPRQHVTSQLTAMASRLASSQVPTYQQAREILSAELGQARLVTPQNISLPQLQELATASLDDPLIQLMEARPAPDRPAVWFVALRSAEPLVGEAITPIGPPLRLYEQRAIVYQIAGRSEYLIWRLTDATRAQQPTELDQVREQVQADAIRLSAQQEAGTHLSNIASLVKAGQLLGDAIDAVNRELAGRLAERPAAATQPDARVETQPAATQPDDVRFFATTYNKQIRRMEYTERGFWPNPNASQAITNAAFELAGPAGDAAATQPDRDRVRVVSQAEFQPSVLVQFESLTRSTDRQLNALYDEVRRLLVGDRQEQFFSQWFEIDNHLEYRELVPVQ